MTVSDQPSDLVKDYLSLLQRSSVPPKVTGSFLSTEYVPHHGSRPVALLLSPHPDDECLVGALPLRLSQELGWQIINIAVTLGSKEERRAGRKIELSQACRMLNFDCMLSDDEGFSKVLHSTRQNDRLSWQKMVRRLASIIGHYQPKAIILPHANDAHPTHIGTYLLGMDALTNQPANFTSSMIQTEYWHPNAEPNLMIGIDEKDTRKLLSALSCHVGENVRNPFDVRFPAFLIDNVRRGSERVGGEGGITAKMNFAMLYKIGLWRGNKFVPSALKKMILPSESMKEVIHFD